MEWLLEIFIHYLFYPINWFWQKYEANKETRNIGKMLLFFILSLSGIVVLVASTILLMGYLLKYHWKMVLIVSSVIWLYLYFKPKNIPPGSNEPGEPEPAPENNMEHQLNYWYHILRRLLYQSLQGITDSIDAAYPMSLEHLSFPDFSYTKVQNVYFYTFRLFKNNWKYTCSEEELEQVQNLLQSNINNIIQAGRFPMFESAVCHDKFGRTWNSVIVELVQDLGQYYQIYLALYSPAYAEYDALLTQQIQEQEQHMSQAIPDATWENRR